MTRQGEILQASDDCRYCGARIHLAEDGGHWKWVTNPDKVSSSWKCGDGPPVLAHRP